MAAITHSPRNAETVRLVNGVEDHLARTVTVDGSNSLADLGYDLHEDAVAVVIANTSGATLFYSPNGGTAGIGNFPIADGDAVRISGNRGKLARLRLYAADAGDIGIVQEIVLQTSPITTTT